MSDNVLNVLYASDNNFSPYLGVSLFSLLKHNTVDFKEINVYVLAKNISNDNKNKLNEIYNQFDNSKLIFIEDKEISEIVGKKVYATRASSSFSRLFAASFLDESINKVLYLDADSLISGSFKELWEKDISDYYVAGVLDIGPDYVKTSVGLDNDVKYINAGVLLINLDKWREEDIESKFIKFLEDYEMNVYNNDQGIINGVLSDKILIVDPKFNLMSPFLEIDYDDVIRWNGLKNHYNKETIENALKNPVFLHFSAFMKGRPWFKGFNHPCSELYLGYANQTPFKDMMGMDDNRSFRYKFFFAFVNYVPFSVLCMIYKPYRDYFIKYF